MSRREFSQTRSVATLAKAARVAVVGLALAACDRGADIGERPMPPPSVAERVRVVNADALIVDGVDLRLANAYGPQPTPHARCWAEVLAARVARRELQTLVTDARTVEIRLTPERDEYNRPLGYVTLDGRDLGDTLYERGVAARRTGARFSWCDPLSQQTDGAPNLHSLVLGSGRG